MEVLRPFFIDSWDALVPDDARANACDALERGQILFFPRLAFVLSGSEQELLVPAVSNGTSKNVSLKPSGALGGTSCTGRQLHMLRGMMERFAITATDFLAALLPGYADRLERAPTSYRPVEIAGRAASPVRDDTRLHVDAFPSRPMRGRRILRLFSNVNPSGSPRVWNVGEPFVDMAVNFLPAAQEHPDWHTWLLGMLGITKGRRSPYDKLMLELHNAAKLDDAYQQLAPRTRVEFPSGSTWVCFTDQVMHAALSGQYVLEQTFHLEVDAMAQPQLSPLRILEHMRGQALA